MAGIPDADNTIRPEMMVFCPDCANAFALEKAVKAAKNAIFTCTGDTYSEVTNRAQIY